MKAFLHIPADYVDDYHVTQVERDARCLPDENAEDKTKALLKKYPGCIAYDTVSRLVEAFNDGEVSDLGYIVIIDDMMSPKDEALLELKRLVRKKGRKEEDGNMILQFAPKEYYRLDVDPLPFVADTEIRMPIANQHGEWQEYLLLQVEVSETGAMSMLFDNENGEYEAMPWELDTDTALLAAEIARNIPEKTLRKFRLADLIQTKKDVKKAAALLIKDYPEELDEYNLFKEEQAPNYDDALENLNEHPSWESSIRAAWDIPRKTT